ncbi:MAG: FG-GAP repeat protein, partial [Planctomycetes bacterium]|nr:FG-GAP repeat protein [Planctomycetota bacterium]
MDGSYGHSLAFITDLDGDGVDEILVGEPGWGAGVVEVRASETSVLFQLVGDSAGSRFGSSVDRAGDVNDDGVEDFVVGAYLDDTNGMDAGLVRVFSGVDGTILYSFYGDAPGDRLGASVSGAGDVNDDGHDDIIAGAYTDSANGANAGSARVYSGLDGSTLHTFYGAAGDELGYAVSGAGDVNNDGHDDVVVGVYKDDPNGNNSGAAIVYSGADGSTIHVIDGDSVDDQFGWSVSGGGDVNGDGFTDVAVGSRGDDNNGSRSGMVRVFSGIDGTLLHQFDGDDPGDEIGQCVDITGDLNGDGYADVVVSSGYDDDGGIDSGFWRAYSGRDGTILYDCRGVTPGGEYGHWVATGGDLNDDGLDDIAVCGRLYPSPPPVKTGAGRVWVYRSVCFDHEFERTDAPNEGFAYAIDGGGDVNGDGFDDFIVGSFLDDTNGNDVGEVRVYSGVDGSLLHGIFGAPSDERFGFSVACGGDVDGDGLEDFAVGIPNASFGGQNDSGTVRAYSGNGTPLFSVHGTTNDLLGSALDDVGDTNGDGFDDLVVAGFDAGFGEVYILSGSDGSVLQTFTRGVPNETFGFSVAGAGDFDGDGYDDVIIGNPYADPLGAMDAGEVYVYSGFDGSLLASRTGAIAG